MSIKRKKIKVNNKARIWYGKWKKCRLREIRLELFSNPKKKKLTLQAENYEKVEYDMKDILGIITDKK